MGYENAIAELEAEWSPEDGFFWRVRQGQFNSTEFQRTLGIVSSIAIGETAEVPRRLVSLLWYAPEFMRWQEDRVREQGGDAVAYAKAIVAMRNEVERLLGVP